MISLAPAIVELILAVGAMALLMLGVFTGKKAFHWVSLLAIALLLFAMLSIAFLPSERMLAFSGMFIVDGFANFTKVLILIGAALALVLSIDFLKRENLDRFEYPVLVVLATLGMTMMVSANDLISLYMGIELQSLSLYVLAAINRDSSRSTEAGLKYFVLGALSSGMLLYGCSLIYGFAGSTEFSAIAATVSGLGDTPIGLVFGLVFLLAGLAFKISAAPFHMWTPDVYEGAPTPVTALFAIAPKIAALALFVRVIYGPFPELAGEWQQIIVFLSIASMAVGAFFALVQTNIKRLMAYSSIGHVGFALVGLAAGTADGVRSMLIYMTIYLVMNVGAFAVIISMRRKDGMSEQIEDLAGLSQTRPGMAFALAVFMFSLAGIPPLAGFFGKFYVFMAAIDAGLITLSVVGVLMSVVGAYYYLRIIKLMYFDEPVTEFDARTSRSLSWVSGIMAAGVILFVAFPSPLVELAGNAARSLFS